MPLSHFSKPLIYATYLCMIKHTEGTLQVYYYSDLKQFSQNLPFPGSWFSPLWQPPLGWSCWKQLQKSWLVPVRTSAWLGKRSCGSCCWTRCRQCLAYWQVSTGGAQCQRPAFRGPALRPWLSVHLSSCFSCYWIWASKQKECGAIFPAPVQCLALGRLKRCFWPTFLKVF